MPTNTGLEIAVIGMAGRFPGAANLGEFWVNLINGKESITPLTDEELLKAGVKKELLSNPKYVKAGCTLEEIEYFDAGFFGYTPNEAMLLDPQIRCFAECAWEALEDAGYDPKRYRKKIGLYAGASQSLYWRLFANLKNQSGLSGHFETNILSNKDFLSSQISYKFGLNGPSMVLDTACSTSLVAIDTACRHLLLRMCNLAIAGGVYISFPQNRGYLYEEGMIASPDGHCRAFDADAKGITGGNGAGVVALKLYEEARKDRDHIYAVIKGCAVNNDGARKMGFTAPSIDGQKEVIKSALKMAEIPVESISYVEAHGTGTRLGDPIELEALKQAFNTTKRQYCGIGSVKTNIGHLDAAAGAAGFIKTVLALKHRQIPPSLHFKKPNPAIDFQNSPFYVNTELTPWRNEAYPLRAGVSSFGIGGTNAHVILEEAPAPEESGPGREWQILLLSARTETALKAAEANLRNYLTQEPGSRLADLCYTLSIGRKEFEYRKALVVRNPREITEAGERLPSQYEGRAGEATKNPILLFPRREFGYMNPEKELYEKEPAFREAMDRCFSGMGQAGIPGVKELIYPTQPSDRPAAPVYPTGMTLPLQFSVEYSLGKLLMKYGIRFQAMLGSGAGEYAAACLAEVMTPEEALQIISAAGKPEQYRERLQRINLQPPKLPWISHRTGRWITLEEAREPGYWLKQPQDQSWFDEGLKWIRGEDNPVVIEMGAGRDSELIGLDPIPLIPDPEGETPDLKQLAEALGRLWVKGVNVDWEAYYKGEKRSRVSLPTYPFERKRYWIEDQEIRSLLNKAGQKERTMEDWFYAPVWKPSFLKLAERNPVAPKNILMFSNNTRFNHNLRGRFLEQGNKLITVTIGNGFQTQAPDQYQINPSDRRDYQKLIADLAAKDRFPELILHFWSSSGAVPEELSIEQFGAEQEKGLYCLLSLIQEWEKSAPGRISSPSGLKIYNFVANVHDIGGEVIVNPEKATLVGINRVLPQEIPGLQCYLVDLIPPDLDPKKENRLIDTIMAEIATESEDKVIVYRNNQRFVEDYPSIRFDPNPHQNQTLQPGGVYLIIGGLGKIGSSIAEYIAGKVTAKIILAGRTTLPEKKDWDQLQNTQAENSKIREGMKTIRNLERLGSEAAYFEVNAANDKQMKEMVAEIERRYGRIDGIIYSAGETQGKSILSSHAVLEIKDFEAQFESKIKGLMVLGEVLRGKEIGFCMIMSSLATVLGGVGFTAYVAANAFIDAFVKRRNALEQADWLSVNWDGWGFDAAADGTVAMSKEEGIRVFERLLTVKPGDRIIISKQDLPEKIEKWIKFKPGQKPAENRTLSGEFDPRPELKVEYQEPTTAPEKIMVEIWREVLGIAGIGVRDNFFDLGGNSLNALNLAARIHKEFNREIPLKEIFAKPTIRELAEFISGQAGSLYEGIGKAASKERYPASSAQKRLYILDQLEGAKLAYNMPMAFAVEGAIDRERLEETFRKLIRRHEAFRTSFELKSGELFQRIHPEVEFQMESPAADQGQIDDIVKRFVTPFDLGKAPLLRVGLARVTQGKHLLLLDMHHIISDGITLGILMKEAKALYEGEALPALTIQYKDYSEWQQKMRMSERMKAEERYWLKQFESDTPALNLPYDYLRPAVQSFEGARIDFKIPPETGRRLEAVLKESRATTYMGLLAVYNVLLAKYSGREDIVVGTSTAGRPHPDLEQVIGMFVNTLALRNRPSGEKSFRTFLGEVKDQAIKAYENQDYQYEELVEKVVSKRDMSRNPLFDVMFVMQNTALKTTEIAGMTFKPYGMENQTAKFDLIFSMGESATGIECSLEYCAKLFKRATIERMIAHFLEILEAVTNHPDIKLEEIRISRKEDSRKYLMEFNPIEAPGGKTAATHFSERFSERFPERFPRPNEKILLTMMPFWAPLTPPLGISCLKSFLQENGYQVRTVDANIIPELWNYHGKYLAALKEAVPEERQGNFHMVGYDVFMNHLMAHLHYEEEQKYQSLVKILVLKNFFCDLDQKQTGRLIEVVTEFYGALSDYLDGLLTRERPTIFGVSVYNSNLAPALFALKTAKEKFPDLITLMGGGVFADQLSMDSPNLQLFLEKTPYLDKVIIGEGELLFLKLLRGELPPDQKTYTLQDLKGETMELSIMAIPDFTDFETGLYPQLASYASRSCPFQCGFCSETVQWGKYRKKAARQVADELTGLSQKYGRQLFLLGDSLINPIVADLATELIDREPSVYWDGYLRVDPPSTQFENTLLWRRGGFYRARLGIESGSQRVLDLMDKKITILQIKAALMSLAYAGIKTTTYWVLGYPGETEADFQQTLDLVAELKDYIYEADWHPFFYYPAGQVQSANWAREKGIQLVYPEEMTDMLITQTWELTAEPEREEIYSRVRRFAEHCKRHNIPNPYSLKEINQADERWKILHKNAVPSLAELRNPRPFLDENKRVQNISILDKVEEDSGDFNF